MAVINCGKKTMKEVLCPIPRYIPDYQRGYSWEKDVEIKEFWEDLCNTISHGYEDYYFGQIVAHNDKTQNRSYVIDGQQRLCTIVLFLLALRSVLTEKCPDNDEAKQIITAINGKWVGLYSVSLDERTLRLNGADDEFYRSEILKNRPKEAKEYKGKSPSQQRLIEAWYFFYDQLSEITHDCPDQQSIVSSVRPYYDRVLNTFSVILVETDDIGEAYVIFESLNARGKNLATADLLKNYIFSISNDLTHNIKTKWTNVVEKLDQIDMTDYIRHLWNAQHPFVREKKLYRAIRDYIKQIHEANAFVFQMADKVDLYVFLCDPSTTPYYNSPEMVKVVHNLSALGAKTFYPVALAMDIMDWDEDRQLRILRRIETLYFRNLKVANQSQSSYDKEFSELAYSIVGKGKTPEEIETEIVKKTIGDEELKTEFSHFSIKQVKTAKFVLRELAGWIQSDTEETGIVGVVENDRKIQLEHIMPQNGSLWEIPDDIHDRYLNYLGNLTLLLGSWNVRSSNKPFDQKKPIYKESEIRLTREISEKDQWGEKEIEERQMRLFEIAKERWPIA